MESSLKGKHEIILQLSEDNMKLNYQLSLCLKTGVNFCSTSEIKVQVERKSNSVSFPLDVYYLDQVLHDINQADDLQAHFNFIHTVPLHVTILKAQMIFMVTMGRLCIKFLSRVQKETSHKLPKVKFPRSMQSLVLNCFDTRGVIKKIIINKRFP